MAYENESYMELMVAQACACDVFSYCKNGNAPIPRNATDATKTLLAAVDAGFGSPAGNSYDPDWIDEYMDLIVDQIGFLVEAFS